MIIGNDDGYNRGFGKYLDENMSVRPHTSEEAEHERRMRGLRGEERERAQEEWDDAHPPRSGSQGSMRGSGKGFGRYLSQE